MPAKDSSLEPLHDPCLPPPRMLPPGACQALSCRGDAVCSRLEVCCYNGCTYTCMEAVQPPPVLDWLVQPKPRRLGSSSWLLDGPEEVSQAESCSTTVDEEGEELLLCPSGFECLILVPEDKDKGIPNCSQCVREPQAGTRTSRRSMCGLSRFCLPGFPSTGELHGILREPSVCFPDGQFLRHEFPKEYPDGDTKNVAEHGKGRRELSIKQQPTANLREHSSSFLPSLGNPWVTTV
ncbi:WAP four-disulfide core domain protein 1-like [Choloepus didactylus]|uniref:WAP four-disulfide core domain protein 1-like n=1 Tax=Choloepus didactylus TaxID=27675 RepID=UPI00189E79D6|nr:WAP four-disulfide core domain protein 1-like [Choloepus didactylus]